MKKLFAIGTLLLSSAAVFASPAAAYDRNTNYNNQVYSRGYTAPAPATWTDRARFDREEKARIELRLREERRERELRRLRFKHSLWNRW